MKTAGALIILVSFSLVGAYFGEAKKRGARECAAFLELLRYARLKVSMLDTPTKEIFRGFENETLDKCGFLQRLCIAEGDEIYFNAFTRAFDSVAGSLSMEDDAKTLVRSFGDVIGKSEREEQLGKMDEISASLEELTKKAAAQATKDSKIYKTLGFSLGAVIFILLL